MRVPITVHSEVFDIESIQPQIDSARGAFADYLAHVPRSTKSMHGLMGPVGKLFGEIKSGRRDPASLKGYAVRVQETGENKRKPSESAMQALEKGVDTTVHLLAKAPLPFHDRIMDRLKYGLYYELRSREAAWYMLWPSFIQEKYATDSDLATAWKQPEIKFSSLRTPKKAEGSREATATAKQRDIAEFWETHGSRKEIEGDEE